MNLMWLVFIFATAAIGVYLYIHTMHREQLQGQRRRPSGDRVDLRSDGTVVNSSPEAATPGDVGYVAPPAQHYTPPAPGESAGQHHGLDFGAHGGHDAGSHGGFDAGSHSGGFGGDTGSGSGGSYAGGGDSGGGFGGDSGSGSGGDGGGGDGGGGGGGGGD